MIIWDFIVKKKKKETMIHILSTYWSRKKNQFKNKEKTPIEKDFMMKSSIYTMKEKYHLSILQDDLDSVIIELERQLILMKKMWIMSLRENRSQSHLRNFIKELETTLILYYVNQIHLFSLVICNTLFLRTVN